MYSGNPNRCTKRRYRILRPLSPLAGWANLQTIQGFLGISGWVLGPLETSCVSQDVSAKDSGPCPQALPFKESHMGSMWCFPKVSWDRRLFLLFCRDLPRFREEPDTQENSVEGCGGLRGEKSRSVPEGGADFPVTILLARKCPYLGKDSISCCQKIGEEFSSSVKIFVRKLFRQVISDSHSLLEFSEIRLNVWDTLWEQMCLSDQGAVSLKKESCANSHAGDQSINLANLYESKMVLNISRS